MIPLIPILLLALAPASRQEEALPRPPPLERPKDPEFEELRRAWLFALKEWDGVRLDISKKKRDPSTLPPHPAIEWWPRFAALGEQQSGAALGWMVAQLDALPMEEEARAAEAASLVDRIAAGHAGEQAAVDALDGLRDLLPKLGEERVLALCRRLFEASEHPEVKARALYTQAWAIRKAHQDDPERLAAAAEIDREIAFGFPGTQAAKHATSSLQPELEKEFFAAEMRWLSEVEALQRRGAAPEEWPPQPMHAFQSRYVPIANAGHHDAKRWVNHLYPAYDQAQRQGLLIGLTWLARELATYYPRDPRTWVAFRIGLLGVVARQWPEERATTALLEHFKKEARLLPLEPLEAALEPLRRAGAPAAQRALATYLVALASIGEDDEAGWRRGLALLQEVVDLHGGRAESGLAHEAAAKRDELSRWMPGQPAPQFFAEDSDGLDFDLRGYRGRVVVLEFWSNVATIDADGIAARNALIERLKSRPFHWLGASTDALTNATFTAQASKLGVRWRNAMLYSFSVPQVYEWGVAKLPTTYVIDAEGILRGRNLPWDELVALVERLVAETEASAPPPADGGREPR
jgi:hypothetical protein